MDVSSSSSSSSSRLLTSWDLRAAAGEPAATVRLQNLGFTATGPQDAWGRPRRPQPASASVEVSLSEAFGASSSGDVVGGDTVHYGLLGKEVLAVLGGAAGGSGDEHEGPSLAGLLAALCRRLVGVEDVVGGGRGGGGGRRRNPDGFIRAAAVRAVHVTVLLPKASLVGGGVSLTGSVLVGAGGADAADADIEARAVMLKIHDLRVPTLIGVNDNERRAEQMVVAGVEVDRWTDETDGYTALERVVVKAMRDSSFETLEALARTLCTKIYQHLRSTSRVPAGRGWRLRVCLEKPIAVPLADAPRVELSLDTVDLDRTLTG